MVRPELNWKYQQRNVLNWVTIALALIDVYVFLWFREGRPLHLVLAGIFLAWLGVYLTDYWQPILYLVVAMILLLTLIPWAVRGLWGGPLGVTASALNAVVFLVFLYLYYYEEIVESPMEV